MDDELKLMIKMGEPDLLLEPLKRAKLFYGDIRGLDWWISQSGLNTIIYLKNM